MGQEWQTNIYNKQLDKQFETDISYLIANYRFWKDEIDRLQRIMYGGSISMNSWGVAQYGIEAVMPKGSSIRSAEELKKMDLRERNRYIRLQRLEVYVYALEYALEILEDEKHKTIYDCLLDGMSYRAIAYHLCVSKDYVQRQRKEIVRQIGQNGQIHAILTSIKIAV